MPILIMFILFFAIPSFGNYYEVRTVNKEANTAVVYGNKLSPGDKLTFKDEYDETCSAQVIKAKKTKAKISFSKCINKEEIKAGVRFNLAKNSNESEDDFDENDTDVFNELATKNEGWYYFFGVGLGSSKIGGKYGFIDSLKVDASFNLELEYFGFYWPLFNHKAMVGVIYSVMADAYVAEDPLDSTYKVTYALGSALLGPSYWHYFGTNIGNGIYVRTDIGFTSHTSIYSSTNPATSETTEEASGYGALLGAGYAFAIGDETRMTAGLHYLHRSADIYYSDTYAVMLGFIF